MPETHVLEPGTLFALQERERLLLRILRRHGMDSLESARIFDASCGDGYMLRQMIQWGARLENVAGVEGNLHAIEYAHRHSPELRIYAGKAEAVPEADESFDLTLAFGVFGGLATEEGATGVARELFRVTRPGGLILVYDARRKLGGGGRNQPVAGDDLRRWFPKCPLRSHSLTLMTPLGSLVARYAPWAHGPMAAIPFLRSHGLHVLRRPALPPGSSLGDLLG